MKLQEYKKHIKGIKLDKLQEGDFNYERLEETFTLSNYAKKIRDEINEKERKNRCNVNLKN